MDAKGVASAGAAPGGVRLKIGIRILGWMHVSLGGLGLAIVLVLWLALATWSDPDRENISEWVMPITLALTAFWFAPGFVGGLALLRGQEWARPMIWIVSALLAPLFPVGTALGRFGIAVLLANHPQPALDEASSWMRLLYSRRFAGLVFAGLAAIGALAVMLGIGWLFRDQLDRPSPQVILPVDGKPPVFEDRRPRFEPSAPISPPDAPGR